MKKLVFAALATLSLAACGATPEDVESDMIRVKSKLPEGCEMSYLGDVRVVNSQYPSRIFNIRCKAADTTTTTESHEQPSGKVLVTIDNVSYELSPVK